MQQQSSQELSVLSMQRASRKFRGQMAKVENNMDGTRIEFNWMSHPAASNLMIELL